VPVRAAQVAAQKGGNYIAAGIEDVGVFVAGQKAVKADNAGDEGEEE
jgi:hypothetical protein